MGYDLLGFGTNAPNVVTARQPDNRVFGAADTFAKDCSSVAAGDGTAIWAAWGVGLLQQLRALIRGNGQTGAAVDIVTPDNSDDTMALKAIQHLIQRGQTRSGGDSGAVNALVVALVPALAEYKFGLSIDVIIGNDNTGPATINVNGLGARTILRNDGTPLQPRDLPINGIVTLKYNGAQFQIDVPAGFSNAAQIITASVNIVMTLQQRALALLRTVAPAAMSITLPAGARNGATVVIDDVAGNLLAAAVTVTAPGGGETITGAATYVMNRNFQSTTFRLYDNGVTRVWSRST